MMFKMISILFFVLQVSFIYSQHNISSLQNSNNNCNFQKYLNVNCASVIPENEGREKLKKLYPWHVGLYRMRKSSSAINVCAGTLISSSVVVTAAHCIAEDFDGSLRDISEYFVTAGNEFREINDKRDEKYSQSREILRVIIPDVYEGHKTNFEGDIAFIKLKNNFELSAFVKPACVSLNNNENLLFNKIGQSVGWGLTKESRHPDTRLVNSFATFLNRSKCSQNIDEEFKKYLAADKFCGEFSNGFSICNTDNGGGFLTVEEDEKRVRRWNLHGIASVGLISKGTCLTKQFSAYTMLNKYNSYICKAFET